MEQLTLANVSKHLTFDVLDEVFKLKTNSGDSIKNVEVSRAAPAGEGLISAVYKLKLKSENQRVSLVVKGLVNSSLLRKSISSVILFKREVLFFSKILPVLIEIQKALGATERIQSTLPVCYGCYVDGEYDYIIMEDLSEKNFKSISANPTIYERDMCLKILAHFHSVSLALRLKKPKVFAKIANGLDEVYYNDGNRDWYANYLKEAINIDRNVLLEIEGSNSIYYKKFYEFTNDDVYGQLVTLATTQGDHPVLSHGDAWCPNFLCSKDKAVTIDFQIMRCTSPATDLSYFIILCCNLCRNKKDYFEAVDVYYKALGYYLNDMGFDVNKVFSLDTLRDELKKYGKFGLLAALTSIPLMASERCDVLLSFDSKYSGYDRIPLEELWRLTPITSEEHKMKLVNAVRVAVDTGLI